MIRLREAVNAHGEMAEVIDSAVGFIDKLKASLHVLHWLVISATFSDIASYCNDDADDGD